MGLEITQPRDFANPDWQKLIRNLAALNGKQRTPDWIDYFVFTRGLFRELPPLVVGRVFWDHWMVWKALQLKKPVVDISRAVVAVHQNHDYRHHPLGKHGVWNGEEAAANHKFAGGWNHLRTIADATHILGTDGLKTNVARYMAVVRRYVRQAGRVVLYRIAQPIWFSALGISRPIRNALGLRAADLRRSRGEA